MQRLADGQEMLNRRINGFRRELQFATALGAGELIRLGQHLLESFRDHIGFVRTLLKAIEEGKVAGEKM
ncbi:MAG: hypothetical protein HY237_02140 [Acidobacteria bacterium]|nr:hypothetical protein [Acidobacteriota bacterium]